MNREPNAAASAGGLRLATCGALVAMGAWIGFAGAAIAATATGTFQSQIQIVAECNVTATNTLNFASSGLLDSNVDTTAVFTVQCTDTTTYSVGLDDGTTTGGSITTRLMTDGSATVSYQMFSDSGRTTNWGETVGSDTVAGTGNGSTQNYTIYGRVPVQTTPAPATYTDTVTITVTY